MTRALIVAAMLALATVPAAHAAGAAPKGIVVGFGDLDLNAAAGQAELKGRLDDAAAKLCGPAFVRLDHPGSEQSAREDRELYHACIGRLSQRAMAKITRN